MITYFTAFLILFGSTFVVSAFRVSGGQATATDDRDAVAPSSVEISYGGPVDPAEYQRVKRLAAKRLRLLGGMELQRNHARGQLRALRRVVWHLRALKRPGWRPKVDACLSELIDREGSHWDPHATNPSSGAYGIPQALPGSKMRSAGADWRDNIATQLRWMVGYVRKYGGSCGALAFHKAHGWY